MSGGFIYTNTPTQAQANTTCRQASTLDERLLFFMYHSLLVLVALTVFVVIVIEYTTHDFEYAACYTVFLPSVWFLYLYAIIYKYIEIIFFCSYRRVKWASTRMSSSTHITQCTLYTAEDQFCWCIWYKNTCHMMKCATLLHWNRKRIYTIYNHMGS